MTSIRSLSAIATPADLAPASVESPRMRAIRRFLRHRVAVAALVVFSAIVLLAVFADVAAGYRYDQIDLQQRAAPPSETHLFGTDRVGRDIWARTIHGARVSLVVGATAAAVSTGIGLTLGVIAGYYRGIIGGFIMRVTEIVMTFPTVVILLTLAAILDRSLTTIALGIGALSWPPIVRLVYGQVLKLREEEYVVAARCLGASQARIMAVHIAPGVLSALLAQATFSFGGAILLEAGLSYLGLGVAPPTPSWGNMIEAARNLETLTYYPWMWLPAAVFTVLSVLCINFIGDGIRDALDQRIVL